MSVPEKLGIPVQSNFGVANRNTGESNSMAPISQANTKISNASLW
jgi:hypothetical protein